MNKFKKIIMGVLVMSMTAAELTACAPDPEKYEEQAVLMLEEKYKEEFEIEKYLGTDSMEQTYRVVAFSKEYPEVLFKAWGACDGSYLSDEYPASRVCNLAGEQIEKNLGTLAGYLQVRVQAVGMSVDSQKADMSVLEFMELKTKNRFAVYLIYSPAGLELKKMYQSLGNTFAGLECMSGNIQLYFTSEQVLEQVQEYLGENADLDYGFDEVLKGVSPVTVPFEHGRIMLSEKEFEEMAGEQQ